MMRSRNRLWSLWDMLQLKAHAFLEAYNHLAQFENIAAKDPDWVYGDDNRRSAMVRQLDALVEHLHLLDLRLAIKKANTIRTLIDGGAEGFAAQTIAESVSNNLGELRERITQQLEDATIYVVPPEKAKFVQDDARSFGQDVQDKLADATYDLAEAATCLGMSRNTACVFHLMRALELALRKLGQSLNAKVIDKHNQDLSWGLIIANVRKKVEELPGGDRKEELAAVASMLYFVKEAWRNSTMHPKQTYTDDEAAAVFDASRSFLRSLAKVI